jgi:beta-barrel assembly-enhancing protease
MRVIFMTLGVIGFIGLQTSCSNVGKGKTGFNLFTIQQDRELGAQVAMELESNPQEYPILDSVRNVAAYKYIYDMRDKILNSGKVIHKDEFQWRIRIIRDDKTLNAFCTPGGYIYVYTGLIKFLDAEDQLAGVMGHEIAHADFRHSTRQITQMYGLQMLLNVLAGDREALKTVTGGLIGLRFSRKHETEADEASVHYLCPTEWDAAGGAKFFKKITELGGVNPPEFLSTHPSPDNRIDNFYNIKLAQGCAGDKENKERYEQFKAMLPQ